MGAGLGSAFVWPVCTPLAVAAILLGLFLLERLPSSTLPACLGIAFGMKALMSLSWFLSAYPITWLFELAQSTQLIVVFTYWSVCALFLSSGGVVLALLWHFCRRLPQRIYVLPLLWVLAEYLGAVIFSIFSAGPGSYITGAFSFGHIGYLFTWLTPLALWGGVYMVGIMGMVLLVAVFQYLRYRQWKFPLAIGAIVLTLLFFAWQQMAVTELHDQILVVNTTFDSLVDDTERAIALREMIEVALMQKADYIILPEDSRYLYQYELPIIGPKAAIEAWQILHASNTAIIIDTGRTIDETTKDIVQRAYIWGNGPDIYTADKQYLVPQGEFMPSLAVWTLRFIGFGPVADGLTGMIDYKSSRRVVAQDADSTIPNILFCSESVNPLAVKRLVQNRPSNFIVHPMSHSWFHEPKVVWRQLDTMLRYQAVYAATPIVSVGNEIRGKVYLPDGTIEEQTIVSTFPYGTIDTIATGSSD